MRACLWRELRSRKLAGYKFRRQQPIGRFIVDSVCLEKRVVIELDGGQHAEPSQSRYDAQRTNWLAKNNFLILRFWDHETLQQLAAVKEAILSALKGQLIHPLPRRERIEVRVLRLIYPSP